MKTDSERIERLEKAVLELRRVLKWMADGSAFQVIWNHIDEIAVEIQHERKEKEAG